MYSAFTHVCIGFVLALSCSFFCFYSIPFYFVKVIFSSLFLFLLFHCLDFPSFLFVIFFLYILVYRCLKYANKTPKIYTVFLTKSVPVLLPLFFLTVFLNFPFPYAYLHMIWHFLDLVHHALNKIFLCEIFSNPCAVLTNFFIQIFRFETV